MPAAPYDAESTRSALLQRRVRHRLGLRRVALLLFTATLSFAPQVLAQTPRRLPAPGVTPLWQKILGGILLVLGVVGIWGIIAVRRYLKDAGEVGDLTLADIRQMRDDGRITAVEYDAMREMLIKRETARLEADATKDDSP